MKEMSFLSPNEEHSPLRGSQQNLSNSQLLAISSLGGISGALFEDANAKDTPGVDEKLSSPEKEMADGQNSFNWRLAYNPLCIGLGLSLLCFNCAMSLAYQCIPPLGKQSGS